MSGRPLTLAIIDDEPLALERLRVLLKDDARVDLVASAGGCESARQVVAKHRPELLLLDIRLRDGTAFDLLRSMPSDYTPMIAFATAYPSYACDAFDVSALGYILKPVEPAKLTALIDRAWQHRELVNASERASELQEVVRQLRAMNVAERQHSKCTELWVRQRGTDHVRVDVDSIDWISSQDDYACIHARGREFLLRLSLDGLMESLDEQVFVRIHRATVVRRDRIASIVLKRIGVREAVLVDGTRLAIGRVHAKNLDWRGIGTKSDN